MTSGTALRTVVAIPIRSFRDAKSRLAPRLAAEDRAGLARRLAEGVIEACASFELTVVTDDDEVARWAAERHVASTPPHTAGLDAAAAHAQRWAAAVGADRVAIVHADLADPAALPSVLARAGDVVIVPDRHRDGSNVIVVACRVPFGFAYGPGSFERHCAEAARLGLGCTVIAHDRLAWDIDVADDLDELEDLALPTGNDTTRRTPPDRDGNTLAP